MVNAEPTIRRHYVLALRDEVPAPNEGWTVFRHLPQCVPGDDSGLLCGGASCSVADVCRLFVFHGQDGRFKDGMADLTEVISQLTGHSPPKRLGIDSMPVRRTVAVVGSMWLKDDTQAEHYSRCHDLLRDSVKALRHATQARTPGLAIERAWPLYAILDEDSEGHYEVHNVVVVEHGFQAVPVATPEQTVQAERVLMAAWLRNPVEVYMDFELEAARAADTDGDYVECVLKAAAAAEVLIKQAAWMLTWEAAVLLPRDPASNASPIEKAADARPSVLIGSVLTPRLKGNWGSQSPLHPVGAWRHDIARRRNSVIHRGYRPTAVEAHAAVSALDELERHVVDRLAAMANVYPHTALLIAGKEGLERRGQFGKARATYQNVQLQDILRDYLSWIDGHVSDDLDE